MRAQPEAAASLRRSQSSLGSHVELLRFMRYWSELSQAYADALTPEVHACGVFACAQQLALAA